MKAVLLGFLTYLAVAGFAAAQPDGTRPGSGSIAPVGRLTPSELSKAVERLKADVESRIQRSMVARAGSDAPTAISRVLDKRLGSAVLQQGLEAFRLRQIQARKRDPQFIGVIDSMTLGGIEITLERRRVRTDRGVQTLLLNRVGHEYIYAGDRKSTRLNSSH